MNANLRAFLDTIAYLSYGPLLLAASDNGYDLMADSTIEAPHRIPAYADHPAAFNKRLRLIGAGRYQGLAGPWGDAKLRLRLPDFTATSQDRWAAHDITSLHAADDVALGYVDRAVAKCSPRWPALADLRNVVAAYHALGGTLAAGLHPGGIP